MKNKISILFITLSLLFLHSNFAQCAGGDNTVIVCNKETDTNYQTFSLFNQLTGTPLVGGEWTSENPSNNFALNVTTGEVNLWKINRFGEHKFTYTNVACGENATITIFLGGYPGEDNVDGGANACSDNTAVNLYTFLDNDLTNLNADLNGTWRGPFVTGEFFDAKLAGPGTYTFTYTVDAVETCLSEFATVVLEVHRAAEPGEPIDIIICETDDFSLYRNINLHDYLVGEDPDGIWSDLNGTNQITSNTDSFISIEDIYDLRGPGNYEFEYTVFRKHGVCNDESSIVKISIPNITAGFRIRNMCKGSPLDIAIDYLSTDDNIPFTHDLEYEIRNTTTDALIYTGSLNDIIVRPESDPMIMPPPPPTDTFTFSIDPNPILIPGEYYVTVKSISDIKGLICNTFSINDTSFVYNSIEYSIDATCFDGTEAILNISDFYDPSGTLSNQTIDIDYTIQDLTNGISRDIEKKSITFKDGVTEIPVDISIFPKNAADFNIQITKPENTGLNCTDFNFKASLIPDDIKLSVIIDNSCDASKIQAVIDAPTLGDGNYTITYQVKKLGETSTLIDNSFVTNNFSSTLNVDIATLDQGNYEVILKSTQTDTNPCRTKFDFEVKDKFSIGGIPDTPVLNDTQTFCLSDFQPNQPTISDIIVNKGTNLTWYADLTSTTPLNVNTVLTNNTNYYVTASDPLNSCESSSRATVNVKTISTSIVNSSNTTPTFCRTDKVTLANFDASVLSGNLIWYDAATGGNILPINTPIENGKSYFAVQNISGCEHHIRLEFNATVITPPNLVVAPNQTFCLSDFQPNQPTINDIIVDEGTNTTWYIDATSTTPLNTNTTLTDGSSYYVTTSNPTNTCESLRAIVTTKVITTSIVTSSNTTPTFCNAGAITLSDFDAVISSGNLVWYDAATGGNILPINTSIEEAKSYFAVQNIDGCEHHVRLEFNASIINPPKPEYTGSNAFCKLDNLTLLDLESNIIPTSTSYNLVWYDDASGGSELSNLDAIEVNTSYYIVYKDPSTDCEGDRTEIIFTTSECDPDKYDFFIPDGFSPNNDRVNDFYFIPNIEYFYPKYELEIFNRYGQSLFKGDLDNSKWNGQNTSGSEVTNGVYFYILRYNKDNLKPKQGRIYLSK